MFLMCVEIVCEIGFKLFNVVEEYLKVLVCKGYIEMFLGIFCGICILVNDEEVVNEDSLLLVGCVVVGMLIEVIEYIEDYYFVSGIMFNLIVDYLFCVNGNLMENIGILDGDLLVVYKMKVVKNG